MVPLHEVLPTPRRRAGVVGAYKMVCDQAHDDQRLDDIDQVDGDTRTHLHQSSAIAQSPHRRAAGRTPRGRDLASRAMAIASKP